MFCPACSAENSSTAGFCSRCGQPLTTEAGATGPAVTGFAPPPYTGPQENSGKAIASLILGVLALPLNIFLLPGICAVVLGRLAQSQIKHSAGRLKGGGMAAAGVVMGYLSLVMMPVFVIIAIAVPSLFRSRIAANESSAVGIIRTINTAQVTYASMYPAVGYTCSLTDLDGTGPAYSKKSAGLIDSVLAGGQKSGYRFILSNCSGSPVDAYQVTAEPIERGQTGIRVFCSDQTGVIRSSATDSVADCLSIGDPL